MKAYTMFFAGNSEQEALAGQPWLDYQQCLMFARYKGYSHVYIGDAIILDGSISAIELP